MANLVLRKDIIRVLEQGCWHRKDEESFNICETCASDIRRYLLENAHRSPYLDSLQQLKPGAHGPGSDF